MSTGRMERRVITAVFIDVVGSTALTVQVGPERLKRALDRAFTELAELITAEGGTVEKYVGDAIHALFGAPTARPDDPQRAVRAAHACLGWADAHAHGSVPLAVRIGVETGEAIVDLAAVETARQQMSVGACVNVAARLQQLAEPGQVLVGPTCAAANADVAEFAALGEMELKGLGRQGVWRLVRLTGPHRGVGASFVGREAELDLLRVAYRRAVAGHSVLALISGPPGQGKTRLVDEFLARLGTEAHVLKARCRPAGELGARSPLQALLTIGDREASTVALSERLAGLFGDATELDRVVTALAHSAGLTVSGELVALPAGQRQDEVTDAWRRYLAALTQHGPLVVWIDDLHWAEGELVQLLDRLTLGGDHPVLVLGTARPEFGAREGVRPAGDRFFITLDALDERSARVLARQIGGADTAGVERAEGNPLFVIELARARSAGAAPDVPLTLQGLIGARLDELPTPDRELLQRAAVVGETFTVRDAALLSGREPGEVVALLERLAELQYLNQVGRGLRFHHALVRDVAYGRLTTVERMHLHARYATTGVQPDDAEALAHHLWEAVGPPDADWVWEGSDELAELRSRAREAHLVAARRYANRFAYEWALETCRRALHFATEPRNLARVTQTIGDVCGAAGNADEAWTHYLRARDLYSDLGEHPPAGLYPSLLEPPVYTSGMFRRYPDDAFVEALTREGEDVARRAGDAAALARLLALRAYRSHDAAVLDEALRLSEEVTDPTSLGSFLEHAAILQIRVGEFDIARRIYARADLISDRPLEFRAVLALHMGSLQDAERLAERLVAASASRGPHLRTHAYREQCHVLLARGDWPGLRRLAAQTERLVAEHRDTSFCYAVTTARAFAVVAHALEGQEAEARAALADATAPLQAEPFERESVLLLAHAAVGDRRQVEALIREVQERSGTVLWFFRRMQATALTMLQEWDALDPVLQPLERIAAKGSRYAEAMVSGIREETAAARGGPRPEHRLLNDLGYVGWSRLLSHRPAPG